MAEKEIHAIMIVEIMGRPAAHVKESLISHVRNLEKLKGVTYLGEKVSEPKNVSEEKDLYSSFAEVEFKTETLSKLMDVIFDFMPSSLEILEPADLRIDSQQMTMFMNDLSGRLHKYDEIARIAQIRNQKMLQQLQIMQQKIVDLQKEPAKKKVTKKLAKKKTTKKVSKKK